jgi:pimeloyl-ACP methyl ester carboxylesterase
MKKKVHIYLLRGLTRESGHWGAFTGFLKTHLPEVEIHLLDLPGSGKYVHEKASVRISKMVDFMRRDFLEDPVGGERIICASSLGGMVACDWVLRYPLDFHGLVMINASFKKICRPGERAQPAVRWDMLRILFSRKLEQREALIVKVNSNKPESHAALITEWTEIQKRRTMSRLNIFKQTIAGMRYGVKGKKPGVPLLIFGSKGDRLVCPSCIEKIHQVFGGTLIWHPDSGHGLPLDEPDWLATEIAGWINTRFRKEQSDKSQNNVA